MPDLYDACVTVAPSVHLRSVEDAVAYLRNVPVWREVYQALKPGAHVIVFTDNLTYDLVSLGIRAAGFENRDTIAAQIPGPTWRPILMFRKPLEGTVADNVLKHGTGALNIDGCRVRHASPEDFAKHKDMVDRIKEKGGSMADSWKNSSDLSGASDVKEGGRWPTNVVMAHAEGCKRLGSKKVKGSHDTTGVWGNQGPGVAYGEWADREVIRSGYTSEDGTEEVEAWECVDGCPIRALDEQTGERPSTLTGRADPDAQHDNPGDNHGASWFGGGNSQVYADSGGASRFFPQFEADKPQGRWPPNVVLTHAEGCKQVGVKEVQGHQLAAGAVGDYQGSKDGHYEEGTGREYAPGTQELVWECVEGCPVKALDEQSGELKTNPGTVTSEMASMGYHGGSGSSREVVTNSGGASRFFPQFEAPPAGLVQWFVRLVTPEGGKILDPFNTGILDA